MFHDSDFYITDDLLATVYIKGKWCSKKELYDLVLNSPIENFHTSTLFLTMNVDPVFSSVVCITFYKYILYQKGEYLG